VDNAADNIIKAYAPLVHGDMSETQNSAAALAQGKGVIAGAKPEQDIHITNNLDYIMDLNQGSSAQAPAAFVEEAVDAGVKAARATKINTGKRS
jgi:hypothetical protein